MQGCLRASGVRELLQQAARMHKRPAATYRPAEALGISHQVLLALELRAGAGAAVGCTGAAPLVSGHALRGPWSRSARVERLVNPLIHLWVNGSAAATC